MEKLLNKIKNPILISSINDCEKEITPILQAFITNFPEYTDHSVNHSKTILKYVSYLLSDELEKLNEDEVYILIMAGYMHDIGMCPTKEMKNEINEDKVFKDSGKSFEDYLRETHHEISYRYITSKWVELKIINETYAEAIALVGMGHRKVDLYDFEKYNPDFPVKSGSEFVCLPFLAGILRLADELDITNDRTPDLLYNNYYPSNKISKQEWDKHKANYFVNFKIDTIRITSKCFEKLLYYALHKQYRKIENVIDYVQKLNRLIPQNERELKLQFNKLDKDIKPLGFIPKEIGFSFDLQNTIDTFIGDNIYRNKNVAIRECVQNSIDTCRYKMQLEISYKPKIKIILTDKKLVFEDNGFGMDEFIVENYFAKLAKSYYTENKIRNQFEAISQFGVGIFSYFLMCDYFDVESKMHNKEAIKFRVNKDANSYFFFFEDQDRVTAGTTITFYLREDFFLEKLIADLKHYFRFIEIPILVECKNKTENIIREELILDKEKEIKNKMAYFRKDEFRDIEIVESKINNDDYEGILGLVIAKDKKLGIKPVYIGNLFDSYNPLQIALSQKGVFVNDTTNQSIGYITGKVNLKRKNPIDIGRYNIKDENYLNNILDDFNIKLLENVFSYIHSKHKQTKALFTSLFLYYYIRENLSEKVLNSCLNKFYFKLYDNSVKYLNLRELFELKEFILLNSDSAFRYGYQYKFENIKEIYKYFNLPLLLENTDAAEAILKFYKTFSHKIEIVSSDKNWFYKFYNTKKLDEDILIRKFDLFLFDNFQICAYPRIGFGRCYNINHKVVKWYKANEEKIIKDQNLYSLFNNFFKIISDFLFDFHSVLSIKNPNNHIKNMNNILNEINKITSNNFRISKNDFPDWINKEIKW